MAKWEINGVPACTSTVLHQVLPSIVSDGFGGAIVVWSQNITGSWEEHAISTQRLNSEGIPMWTPEGILLSTTPGYQEFIGLISSTDGAIVAWADASYNDCNYIFVQRINLDGEVQWTPGGVRLSETSYGQMHPRLIPDGSDGAIITWIDHYSNLRGNIRAQRINSSEELMWSSDGVDVCTIPVCRRERPGIVGSDSGSAIIIWCDNREGSWNVYAQKVDENGVCLWQDQGVRIASGYSPYTRITSDSAGGAIVVFGRESSIYTQRIDREGYILWDSTGVLICEDTGEYYELSIVSDQYGGAIVFWADTRDCIYPYEWDIYAQRIDCFGEVQWEPNGIPVCTQWFEQSNPVATIDGCGGAIVAWQDSRSYGGDIYAQRVNDIVGIETQTNNLPDGFHLIGSYPNPFTDRTIIKYALSRTSKVHLEIFDVSGRKVKTLIDEEKGPGLYTMRWTAEENPSGIYFVRFVAGNYKEMKKLILLK